MSNKGKAPQGLAARGGRGAEDGFDYRHCYYKREIDKSQYPVALQIHKRGKICTVAKLTHFNGDHTPILAIAWRNQQGTREAVSVPLLVLDYAQAHGARQFVLRNDRTGRMYAIGLDEMRHAGWIGADGELYIKIGDLHPVPWRDWAYATEVVRLDEALKGEPEPEAEATPEAKPQQLALVWEVKR